jgi:hypothetical protein
MIHLITKEIATMHIWKTLLATTAVLGCTQIAKADLTINGETGLFLNPTAAIVQKDKPQIQANYFDLGTHYEDKFYGIYGAMQAADKLEISAGIDKFDSSNKYPTAWDRNGFDVGAKYQLFTQQAKGFSLAIGGGYDRGLIDNIRVYAAASKSFNSSSKRAPIIGTLGVRWDRYTDFSVSESDDHSSKISAFAGAEVPLTRDGALSLIGEIQTKNVGGSLTASSDAQFPYSLGLRYHPRNQAFSLGAGIARQGLNTPIESQPRFFVQAGYTFGK